MGEAVKPLDAAGVLNIFEKTFNFGGYMLFPSFSLAADNQSTYICTMLS